ncbi:putative bifunctional diguanylate cyclase/phosphodiesterase [Methylobacterium sp. A54F]
MQCVSLSRVGGEFLCSDREAAFQADRLPETLRHAGLLFGLSAVLNFLFLASDWRFHGTDHFWVAVPARLILVAASIACLASVRRMRTFLALQRLMLGWEAVATVCVGLLVSSRSDIALFVVLLLPAIFLLVVPTSFRWTVCVGLASTIALMACYMLPPPVPDTALGLVLAVFIEAVALLLVVVRSNRLRRFEWAAVQAERRANAELEESQRLFETLFKAVPIPVVVSTVAEGRFTGMNDAAYRFFGIAGPAQLSALTTRDLMAGANRRILHDVLHRDARVHDHETSLMTADGGRRDVLLSLEPVEIGGNACVISTLVDITARKATEEAVREAANHDVLTGLPNRGLFQATLDAAIERAAEEGGQVGLILLDLDDFKEVNDTLGHDAGDALLKEVGRRLSGLVGPGDLVARLGGDEFVVVTGDDEDGLAARAAAVLAVLEPSIGIGGRSVTPRASLGLAGYPTHAQSAADLLTNADLALYAAKGAGRNQARPFEPALRASIEERVTIAREMRTALAEGQVVPYYQPKVCLASGAVIGFEALARWRHPTRGVLAPSAFASVFDDPEIGAAVGTCLAAQVARDVAGWLDRGLEPGRVFINLSTAQFADPGGGAGILATLGSTGVAHDRFGVEVTETVLLGDQAERVAAMLQQLHGAGIRVALDDFGTGYASLTHLKQFPVDEIKIDRSFVSDLTRDMNDAAIVTAVLQLGRSLGLTVVAEGVETAEQAAFLKAGGCAQAQGYLYARPTAPDAVPALLEACARAVPVAA